MKKSLTSAAAALLVLSSALTACSGKDAKTDSPAPKAKAEVQGQLPNYRYVDIDTVLSKYHLAKDYNEEMARVQSNMENEVNRHKNAIQNKALSIQQKMKSNGYANEAAYNTDNNQLSALQNNAQNAITKLEEDYQTQAMKAQKTVTDSIEAFIQEYNKTRGYDAIFFKNATLYINPALDITDEVVEGLNSRYNKVKK